MIFPFITNESHFCDFCKWENSLVREYIEKENSSKDFEVQNNNEFIADLASFFDELAKFDYQDKQKEKL